MVCTPPVLLLVLLPLYTFGLSLVGGVPILGFAKRSMSSLLFTLLVLVLFGLGPAGGAGLLPGGYPRIAGFILSRPGAFTLLK